MKISNTLVNYLNSAHTTINSEIIVTSKESILYSTNQTYLNLDISKQLSILLEEWENSLIDDITYILPKDFLPLYNKDSTKYTGQMIFPIIHNSKIDGILIFFRTTQDFIVSSTKYGLSIQHFTEIFSDNDFIDKK